MRVASAVLLDGWAAAAEAASASTESERIRQRRGERNSLAWDGEELRGWFGITRPAGGTFRMAGCRVNARSGCAKVPVGGVDVRNDERER